MKQFGKALWLPVTAVFLLTGLLLFFPVGNEREVYDKVIRLHVLANSDSEEE